MQILIQRSYTLRFLSHNARDKYTFFFQLGTRQFASESVITGLWTLLWLVYINLPFRSGLDGVLQGLKAGRGSAAGAAAGTEPVPNLAEPRSIASRALFSHLVAFTFKHYRKPFEVADVPALREDYTPAVALADWRVALAANGDGATPAATRSTDRSGAPTPMRNLAGKLLWHFRTDFLLQACWVTSSTVFSFFPPVFLRSLLQYVAARKSGDLEAAPLHIGVLYVSLMVGGQILNAVSYSQTLNIGRRVCIKSRAIIIAELFAKALRRRDLSANVNDAKSSGETAKEGEEGAASSSPADKAEAEAELPEANISALVGVDSFYVSEISGKSRSQYGRSRSLIYVLPYRLPLLFFVVLPGRCRRHGLARSFAR